MQETSTLPSYKIPSLMAQIKSYPPKSPLFPGRGGGIPGGTVENDGKTSYF